MAPKISKTKAQLAAETELLGQILERRTRETSVLAAAISAVARTSNLDEIFQAVIQGALELVSAERGALFLWDEAEQVLIPAAAVGRPLPGAWLPKPCTTVFQSGLYWRIRAASAAEMRSLSMLLRIMKRQQKSLTSRLWASSMLRACSRRRPYNSLLLTSVDNVRAVRQPRGTVLPI